MKKTIILHGTLGSPEGNWFRWLEAKLKGRGLNVWLPQLPHAEQPSMTEWAEFIRDTCPFKIDEDTILIGHSSGAIEALIIAQQNPQPVGVVMAVSVFVDNSLQWEPNDRFFDVTFNYPMIKSQVKQWLFVHSDNDPYVPLPQAERVAKSCGSSVHLVPGQGHFNLELSESYRTFPKLIELMESEKILT